MRKEERLRGLAEWAQPLIERAIDQGVALSGARSKNQYYVASWLYRQLVPGSEVEKRDIEEAYARHLYGVVFDHVEQENKNGECVSRVVRKG